MILEDSTEARAWGVLFALSLRGDGTISGRVTLNKTLAYLQCDGFPIENRFINKDMGPYDWRIHEDAEDLEREKLLEITEKPTRHDRPTTVYHINDEGLGEVQRKYPAKIESIPYQRLVRAHLEEIKKKFSEYTTPEIVEKFHHELLMDIEEADAQREMDCLVTDLMVAREAAEMDRDPTCFICLSLLGCLDFGVESLKLALKKTYGTNESSRNLIYYSAKQLLHWAGKLPGHEHTRYSREGEGPLADPREQLGFRLYCTEKLGSRYEIIKPIRDEASLYEYIQTMSA